MLCSPRDTEAFAPFPELPAEPTQILATWLSATRIIPVSAVDWVCTDLWSIRERRVADAMWLWVYHGSGSGWLGTPANSFRYGPGDLVLIPQGMPHAISKDDGAQIQQCAVHFFAHLYACVDILSAVGLGGVYSAEDGAPFAEANAMLMREYARKPLGWQQTMVACIWQVLAHILRHPHTGHAQPAPMASQRGLHRLQPVFTYIDAHLVDPELRVGELADCLHISEVMLRKHFQQSVGVSPITFIRRQRITRACTLLRTTNLSVAQIAPQCGFNDLPFFFRAFRQVIGTTPRQYRLRQDE